MKTRFYIGILGVLAFTTMNAQNQYDMSHLLGNELNGTARFVGMGGAMGALGGDISVIGTNPAGIGIFRSHDFSTSFGVNNTKTESTFNGTKMNEDKTLASFDQIGFVYSNKIGDYTSLKYVNFGFNYHKDKNFNRIFSAGGGLNNLSQSYQLAQELYSAGVNTQTKFNDILDSKNPYADYNGQYPMLSLMGAKTGVVDFFDQTNKPIGWDGRNNNYYSKESGGLNCYDFNVAFNVDNQFYFGATLGVVDVDYNLFSTYTENLNDDNGLDNGGYTLDNNYSISGTGVNLKLGMIIRPIVDSPFRLGLAVTTPTWYDLRERYNATMSSDIRFFEGAYSQTLSDYLNNDYLTYDYNFVTPWKFNLSLGTTLSNVLAFGAEYEYEDYSTSKLKDVDGYELGGNSSLEYLKAVSTVRVGMEAKLSPEFSFRAGYNYTSGAFKNDSYNALAYYSTRTSFNNTKERNTLTLGMGYRGSVIYADLAYKYDLYKSDFYAFDDIDLPATKVDNTRNQLIFTLGARF